LVDVADLKSASARSTGSIPVLGISKLSQLVPESPTKPATAGFFVILLSQVVSTRATKSRVLGGANWGYQNANVLNIPQVEEDLGGMGLTHLRIRKLVPQDKTFRISDDRGMYLEVRPNGSKYWRLKYRYLGKEKLLALGRRCLFGVAIAFALMADALGEVGCTRHRLAAHKFRPQSVQLRYGAFEGVVAGHSR